MKKIKYAIASLLLFSTTQYSESKTKELHLLFEGSYNIYINLKAHPSGSEDTTVTVSNYYEEILKIDLDRSGSIVWDQDLITKTAGYGLSTYQGDNGTDVDLFGLPPGVYNVSVVSNITDENISISYSNESPESLHLPETEPTEIEPEEHSNAISSITYEDPKIGIGYVEQNETIQLDFHIPTGTFGSNAILYNIYKCNNGEGVLVATVELTDTGNGHYEEYFDGLDGYFDSHGSGGYNPEYREGYWILYPNNPGFYYLEIIDYQKTPNDLTEWTNHNGDYTTYTEFKSDNTIRSYLWEVY